MQIVMPRGDLVKKTFVIRMPDKTPYTDALDEIYLTVKKSYLERNYKFQKRLSDGGIEYIGDGRYKFAIEPEDTNTLEFGDYDFDIEIVKIGEIKKTFTGTLTLTMESTHAVNEE